MGRKPTQIPFDKKIEVWRRWKNGEKKEAISINAEISDYYVKKLKNELRDYSYESWRTLDDYPDIQYLYE